jgi:hypothetical protein
MFKKSNEKRGISRILALVVAMTLALGMMPLAAMADTTIEGDGETSISLTTTVPELSSITVTPPTKTQYNVGEELTTTGMAVTASYADGSTKDVTSAAILSGFDSSTAGEVTVTVSYTEDGVTKTATFTATIVEPVTTTYTISVSADPSEGGTVSGGGEYSENASVTVTATANEHYTFVKWTEGGEQVSTSASYTFNATANRTLVAVFEAEEVIYTVTVQPGEGAGTAFTVDSSTVITRAEMMAGNYDETKGCFYLDNDGKVYYLLPRQCPFTAPTDKEFDCWQCSFGGTYSGGSSFDIASTGDFTITALYKDAEPQSSVTLSIPASIPVTYGDTQTAFDIQVKSVTLNNQDMIGIILWDSAFSNANGDTIPFTVNCNGMNATRNNNAGWARIHFSSDSQPEYPYSYQGFINITSDTWAAAKPGSYTATLRLAVFFN